MNHYKASLLALVCAAGFGGAPSAWADDYPCPPNRGAVTIDGNIVVRGTCTLNGTNVKGNVLMYSGTLRVVGANIDGSIQVKNGSSVRVENTLVKGDIQLEKLAGATSVMLRNSVDGNIQMKQNRKYLDVRANRVGADIQAFSNTGGLRIANNSVDGNLQCKSNTPAPTGSGNIVSGNKEDQCRRL
jgi:hypothetical protein